MTARFSLPDRTTTETRAWQLYEVWRAKLITAGRADSTIEDYAHALGRFLVHPGVSGDPSLWTADDIDLYLASLRKSGLAASTMEWHRRHLFAYISFLVKRKTISRVNDPREGVERATVVRKRHRTATPGVVIQLLTATTMSHQRQAARNRAIVQLFWSSGVRRAELAASLNEDLHLVGDAWMRVEHTKTNQVREVPISAECREALIEYLDVRGRHPGPLFEAEGGGALSSDAIRLVIQRMARRAGIQVSSHDFRRGFAADVRRKGLDLGHAMALLGHSTPTMTLLYSAEGENEAALEAVRRIREPKKRKA